MLEVDRAAISTFRLSRHHLAWRLPARSVVDAFAACGIQETRLRTAILALHARVDDVSGAAFDRAREQDRTLLTTWAMRGAPYVVPAGEAAIFTAGAVPVGEDSWSTFFGGWAGTWRERHPELSLGALVEKAAAAALDVLDGWQLPVEEFRQEMATRMPELRGLTPPTGAHADLPEPLFRATGLVGVVCIADTRRMTDAVLARTDQWLGRPRPAEPADGDAARAELLRRFLRTYGPSTPQAFAEWTGRSVTDVHTIFDAIESDLIQVRADRSAAWLCATNVDAVTTPVKATGVRLLPNQDPFLQQRDRETLLADRDLRRRVWRPVGAPGLVLVAGNPAGTWTARTVGRTLKVEVEPFGRLSTSARQAIDDEGRAIGRLRDARETNVTIRAPA